jgi:hypothetical protein
MRNEPVQEPLIQPISNRTTTAETAKANLISLLSELGYDSSKYEHAGLRKQPDQATLIGAIRENLRQHQVLSAPESAPNGWPHQEDILVVTASRDKSSALLNRFADWVEQQMPSAKLFFDPMIGYMTSSKGGGSHWGISLPLSLAIEPEKLWHPHDPTFGHELIHFLSASLFNRGKAVAFKVDLTPKEPFIGTHEYNSGQSAEELLAHRYNLKHALGRLARSVADLGISGEALDAQTSVITEIIYLGSFAIKTKELIEDYTNAMLSDDRHVKFKYEPFNTGCCIMLSLPKEDSATQIAVWTREATADGVHRAMADYFERLYSLSSAIDEVTRNFWPKFKETKYFQHLADGGQGEFCEHEPYLVSLIQSVGNSILGLYRQNDFTLEKNTVGHSELFNRLRQALEVS